VTPLFARAGVARPLAYWEGFAGAFNPLYAYMLRWESLDERFATFERFYTDPDWIAQRAASDAGDNMVDRIDLMILRPSSAWAPHRSDCAGGPLHELRLQRLSTRNSPEAHRVIGEVDLPFMTARGATVLGAFQVWYGAGTPQAVTILAWPEEATRSAAYAAFEADATIAARRAEERQQFGAPLFRTARSTLMRPTSYGRPMPNLAPRV
jgi:hypothetical protein